MSYLPHTPQEIQEMLEAIGVSSVEQLFSDIPSTLRAKSFSLPEGESEYEVTERFRKLAAKNATHLKTFLGGGFYDHYVPAAVDAIAGRADFYTAYTPYQPECSQGWLQAIFEYQTAICELTGHDVTNASMYDGGTALFEAVMMAIRLTGRSRIVLDGGVNPIYRSMVRSHTKNLDVNLIETRATGKQSDREEIQRLLDDTTAAVIVQNPDFFGVIDDHSDIVEKAHGCGALVIQSVYPVALGVLKSPGEMGVDIAAGEGQSLGLPLSFGGPYLGFITTKKEFVRKLPGRIVGQSTDINGNRGFVLTLQAREQHIRREKATSNICSNEALCALRAVVYLSLLGKGGIRQLAKTNYWNCEFAKAVFSRIQGVEISKDQPTFNEFVVSLTRNATEVASGMIEKGFVCGLPLGRFYSDRQNQLLISVTEKRTREEIVACAESLEAVLCN